LSRGYQWQHCIIIVIIPPHQLLTSAASVAQVWEAPQVAHADCEAESRHGEVETSAPCATIFRLLLRRRRRHRPDWKHGALPGFPAGPAVCQRRVSNREEAGYCRTLLAAKQCRATRINSRSSSSSSSSSSSISETAPTGQ